LDRVEKRVTLVTFIEISEVRLLLHR